MKYVNTLIMSFIQRHSVLNAPVFYLSCPIEIDFGHLSKVNIAHNDSRKSDVLVTKGTANLTTYSVFKLSKIKFSTYRGKL